MHSLSGDINLSRDLVVEIMQLVNSFINQSINQSINQVQIRLVELITKRQHSFPLVSVVKSILMQEFDIPMPLSLKERADRRQKGVQSNENESECANDCCVMRV